MTTDATSDAHDPYTWLLMFMRETRRQSAALQDTDAGAEAALTFFQEQLPGYHQVLEQALFPLLKRRLRDDDDTQEETLRQTLFLASGDLLACLERLATMTSSPPADIATTHALITSFLHHLDLHLEKMDTVILPAVPARLSECDITLLASSLKRHPARSPCPSTHSTENIHDAR